MLFLYVCVVWSSYTKRNITNLEQIERRATRVILGEEYTEHERLSKLNLSPLQLYRVIHDLVFSFKRLKNKHDLDIFENVLFRSRNQSWEILII